MDEEGRLRSLTQKAASRIEARKPQLLGDIVGKYVTSRLEPQHDAFSRVAAAWSQIVPDEFAAFCRVTEVARGTARVAVNSPSHLHRLRQASSGLLTDLQERTGKRLVRNIRFEIGC